MPKRNLHIKDKFINFFRKNSKFSNNKFFGCIGIILFILIIFLILVSKKSNSEINSHGKVNIERNRKSFNTFNNNFLPIGVEEKERASQKKEETKLFHKALNEIRSSQEKKSSEKQNVTGNILSNRVKKTLSPLNHLNKKKYPTRALVFDESGKKNNLLDEGTLIPVVLLTHVNMKNTKAPVRFKVIEDIYSENGEIIITEGSICIGSLSGFNDQGRAFGRVRSVKVIGEKLIKLESDILSADESYGISGLYFDSKGKHVAGTLIATFASSFAKGFQSTMVSELGGKLAKYSEGNLKNAFFTALEKTAFDIASMEAEKLKKSTPFIIIPQGTPAILMVGNTLEIQ